MDISVNFKGGGSIVTHRPVFSNDGEQVFVSWKNSILSYNTKTGKLIHEYKGLSNKIVGFSVHTYSTYQCLTACSIAGDIIVWKTATHFNIFEKKISRPFDNQVKTFHIIPSDNDELLALIAFRENNFLQFGLYDIIKKNCKRYDLKLHMGTFALDVSANEGYFSVVKGNQLYFQKLHNFQEVRKVSIHNSRQFTCVACHPTEEIVLTGDSSGRVVAWQGLFLERHTQAVYHWHTLPVKCVDFSTSGTFFYSGGEENVLVKWNLNDPYERRFVPRLPADIKHISVAEDNIYVALATSDNAVRIMDCTLSQKTLIQHLVLGNQFETGIVFDPNTKALAMNGNVGHIQFYSPNDMSLLYNVDIVAKNKISNERDCIIQNTEVTKVAISKNGGWLVTVEERKDMEYQYEIRLKFWKFNRTKQTFQLNTSVEHPHALSVNSVLFQPVGNEKELKCVTVGNDRKFKVWQLVQLATVYNEGEAWECSCTGFYRDLDCLGLSFSTDGSLMAIGFDTLLTAWSPETCELKCSLYHPSHTGGKITHIQFGYGNQCHLLVAASKERLSVWNLLTLSMMWTVTVRVSLLVADPLSVNMAVFTQYKKVFVFSPSSLEPIYKSGNLIKKHGNVVAATFVPSKYSFDSRRSWHERSHLYFVDKDRELFCISTKETEDEMSLDANEAASTTPLGLIPNVKTNSVNALEPAKHIYEKDLGTIKKYTEAALSTMPPIRFACNSLLKSLVLQMPD